MVPHLNFKTITVSEQRNVKGIFKHFETVPVSNIVSFHIISLSTLIFTAHQYIGLYTKTEKEYCNFCMHILLDHYMTETVVNMLSVS